MIDQRNKNVSFGGALKSFFKGFVDFTGYSSRMGHWAPVGVIYVSFFVLLYITIYSTFASSYYNFSAFDISSAYYYIANGLGLIIFLVILFLVLHIGITASFARRLRDVGFSNWGLTILIVLFYLLNYWQISLISFVYNIAFFFVLMSLPANIVVTHKNDEFSKFVFRQSNEAKAYYGQFAPQGFNPNVNGQNFNPNAQGFNPNQNGQNFNPSAQGFNPNQNGQNFNPNAQGFNPNANRNPQNVSGSNFNPNAPHNRFNQNTKPNTSQAGFNGQPFTPGGQPGNGHNPNINAQNNYQGQSFNPNAETTHSGQNFNFGQATHSASNINSGHSGQPINPGSQPSGFQNEQPQQFTVVNHQPKVEQDIKKEQTLEQTNENSTETVVKTTSENTEVTQNSTKKPVEKLSRKANRLSKLSQNEDDFSSFKRRKK